MRNLFLFCCSLIYFIHASTSPQQEVPINASILIIGTNTNPDLMAQLAQKGHSAYSINNDAYIKDALQKNHIDIIILTDTNLRSIARTAPLIAANAKNALTIWVKTPEAAHLVKKTFQHKGSYPASIKTDSLTEIDAIIENNTLNAPATAYASTTRTHLNILFIVDRFPALTETFVLNQMTGLIDRGHHVSIYTKYFPLNHKPHPDVVKYELDKKIYYQNTIANLLSIQKPDIICCHFGTNATKGAYLIEAYNLSAKLCVVFHGYDMSIITQENPSYYNKVRHKIDLCLPVSTYWQDKLINLGFDPQKIIVHHMGIDPNVITFKTREKPNTGDPINLISVARLVEKKGLEFSIRAVADLIKKYSDIQYTIVGDGPLKTRLQILINQLNANNHIHLVGSKSHPETIDLLNNAHIILSPSVTAANGDQEGIPVSLMEAMAMGLPVISTLHTGIPELVQHNVSGLLAPEKNVEQFRAYIANLLEHPELWKPMGQAGKNIVDKEFNIQLLNDRLEKIFYQLIQN